ncbi:proteolipid protein 2 [Pongo pygmaeus]|uniref:Proteolipid protein 2 n=2 Tax=Pongo abelii TaxID=9601 RepID=H2PVL6_PONAB
MGRPGGYAPGWEYPWGAGRGGFRGGSHLARLRPRPRQLCAVIHSLLRPGAPFPARRRARQLGVQRPRNHEQACRSSEAPGTPAHAMSDSERLSAPGCWAACTNFSRTRKGILLFAEIILCLVILICFSASTPGYSSLSVIEMILAAIFFVVYMCDLHTKIPFINWPWSDFLRTLIAAILYLITSIVVLVERGNHSKIVAGVLGLIATCLFGYDAYVTFPLRQPRHTAAPTDPADGPV